MYLERNKVVKTLLLGQVHWRLTHPASERALNDGTDGVQLVSFYDTLESLPSGLEPLLDNLGGFILRIGFIHILFFRSNLHINVLNPIHFTSIQIKS